jgi:hypothetical protein
VGEDGSLQLNRSIEGLKGKLKIRVMASDFDTTSAVLKELENQLPETVCQHICIEATT